jgi:hypothetical protein
MKNSDEKNFSLAFQRGDDYRTIVGSQIKNLLSCSYFVCDVCVCVCVCVLVQEILL